MGFQIENNVIKKYIEEGVADIVIPDGIVGIENRAFSNCKNLTSILIPNSVTKIGYRAFSRCTSLLSIQIPDSVTTIGNEVFCGCHSLSSVKLPSNIRNIGSRMFDSCYELKSIQIPEHVTSIGDLAFNYSGITYVVLPDSVTSVGECAFRCCSDMTSITLPLGITTVGASVFEYCGNLSQIVISDSVPQGITQTLIIKSFSKLFSYGHRPKSVIIPSFGRLFVDENENSNILAHLVVKLTLGKVTADLLQKVECQKTKDLVYLHLCRKGNKDCLNYVKRYLWRFVKNAVMASRLDELDEFKRYGFFTKTTLDSLVEHYIINNNSEIVSYFLAIAGENKIFEVDDIDKYFEMASKNTLISSQLLEYEHRFFNSEQIEVIEARQNDRAIGVREKTWSYWKTEYRLNINNEEIILLDYIASDLVVHMPDNICQKPITIISRQAFSPLKIALNPEERKIRREITKIEIGSYVKIIKESAFRSCINLKIITIPSCLTLIDDYVFSNCISLESIIIPNGVISIGRSAFRGCKSLAELVIPESVYRIGKFAFYGCTNLHNITIPKSVTTIEEGAFERTHWLENNKDEFIILGRGILYKYNGNSDNVIIPESVKSIGKGAFSNCTSVTNIVIPNSVSIIEDEAFRGCKELKSITIPSSVKRIGLYPFKGCRKKIEILAQHESLAFEYARENQFIVKELSAIENT